MYCLRINVWCVSNESLSRPLVLVEIMGSNPIDFIVF
jgi:hypothetical protein